MRQLIGVDQGEGDAGDVQETTRAAALQRGSLPRSVVRLALRRCIQSQAVASEGSRKPRKASSSKTGAMKVPKMATSQTSAGVRKKSSMGRVLGIGR